jgi:hypothetical protein
VANAGGGGVRLKRYRSFRATDDPDAFLVVVPLERDFDWSRAEISFEISVNLLWPHRSVRGRADEPLWPVGKERSSIVFGWIVAGHQLGAAMAAFAAGAMRA